MCSASTKYVSAVKVRDDTSAESVLQSEIRLRAWLARNSKGQQVDRPIRSKDGAPMLWLALEGRRKKKGDGDEALLVTGHRRDGSSATAVRGPCGLELAEILLREGSANPYVENNEGESLLAYCLENDDIDAVNLLVSYGHGPILCSPWGSDGRHVLCYAAERCSKPVVELLARKVSNVSIQSGPTMRSPLHTACYLGRYDIVQLLLQRGGSTTVKDASGMRPGDLFADFVPQETRLLIQSLLQIAVQSRCLSFQNAAKESDIKGVRNFVLFGGGILTPRDECGYTLLHWGSRKGSLEFIRALCEEFRFSVHDKAQLPNGRGDGTTPLHWAARRGDVEIVRYLMQQGADPNAVDEHNKKAGDTFKHGVLMKASHRDAIKATLRGELAS